MSDRLLLVCAALTTAVMAVAAAGPTARADSLEHIGKKLGQDQADAEHLASGIRRPAEIGAGAGSGKDIATRRTIDAQVDFGVGDYDTAAIILYDVVERYPHHKVYDEALYYLAESLFKKGDFVASRTYFAKLVKEEGQKSRFYQQSLERLVELTLKLNDSTGIDQWLSLLDAVPAAERRSSVPYVRGKYAFYKGDYAEALKQFGQVAPRTPYYFQARYFVGATYVAQKDLAKAVTEYQNLVRIQPKNKNDKRVIELSYMALGRIHYERNQPSKAIDRYLEISRKSDLFGETMYEAAWVYVKNKEYDKALRALELLALSDPMSTRLPKVKILEGNLRIRKAQKLSESDNMAQASRDQYELARSTFEQLREVFAHPYEELQRIVAEKQDPALYLPQITRRHAEVFDVKATLPEVAAAWLREEPEVRRVIAIEGDLGQIDGDITQAEQTIERLERAINTPSRVNIFPELADKRIHATEILDDVTGLRIDLADQEAAMLRGAGGDQARLAQLVAARKEAARQLAALPDAGLEESERVGRARARVGSVDKSAAEAGTVIGQTEAELVAVEKYLRDQGYKEVKPGDLRKIRTEIEQNRAEVEAMKKELAAIHNDTLLAKDRAGTGDENAIQRRNLREALRGALDAEHAMARSMLGGAGGSDAGKLQQIELLIGQADSIENRLDQANAKITSIVEEALVEVRTTLDDEKAQLAAYRQEYTNYDGESHGLGGDVLAGAFVTVSKKLYGVLMRSDVGLVDVAWSVKEGADHKLRRLTLEQAREARTLDSEFADIIQEIRNKRAAEEEARQKAQSQGAGDSGKDQGDGAGAGEGGTP